MRWGRLREEKMQEGDQGFSFGFAKFQTSFRHPSRDVKKKQGDIWVWGIGERFGLEIPIWEFLAYR